MSLLMWQYDLPQDAAVGQTIESFIDPGQRQGPAAQPIDRQATLLVEIDITRDVSDWDATADIASHQRPLLGDERHRRKRQSLIVMWQAGRHRHAAAPCHRKRGLQRRRSEEHTSELQSLMRNSYAVFCLKKKKS